MPRDRLDETTQRVRARLSDELADLDPEAAMIAELIRRGVVADVAELLKPGMGPMTIPADVGELLAQYPAPYLTHNRIAPHLGPNEVRLTSRVEGGRIALDLTVNEYRVWDGVLRPGPYRLWTAAT